jgi:Fic family protein
MKAIREKFRLAYNYNSNHIEGNSLTMQETRSLLLMEIDSSATKAVTEKKKRDEKEMIGHDKAITTLGLMDKLNFAETEIKANAEIEIFHKLIKELNKMILVEDYKKRVIDVNGDQLFEEVKVGQYKTKNNHVKRRDGSTFKFADVSETQALMTDLIARYNKKKDELHPIVLASMFHYKFIRIHPFDDGNGRVCRLLVNMMLMNAGYPLFIVPTDQKDEYYDLLEYLDQQFPDLYEAIKSDESEKFIPWTEYITQRVIWSIDQMIQVRHQTLMNEE